MHPNVWDRDLPLPEARRVSMGSATVRTAPMRNARPIVNSDTRTVIHKHSLVAKTILYSLFLFFSMRTRKQVLWWLFNGTRGAYNRARIVQSLSHTPQNPHQLSQTLHIEYKTVRHHLDVLEKNGVVEGLGADYANSYFLCDLDEDERALMNDLLRKMGLEALG
jgi:DNA-binding transcriptional ArsR family regulator